MGLWSSNVGEGVVCRYSRTCFFSCLHSMARIVAQKRLFALEVSCVSHGTASFVQQDVRICVPANKYLVPVFLSRSHQFCHCSRRTRMSSGGTSMGTTSMALGWTMRASTTTSCRGERSVCGSALIVSCLAVTGSKIQVYPA